MPRMFKENGGKMFSSTGRRLDEALFREIPARELRLDWNKKKGRWAPEAGELTVLRQGQRGSVGPAEREDVLSTWVSRFPGGEKLNP